mmetsp:Transcript_12170/g.48927  ORF Transcript_12170/g.48927 Transcript_12170/m.48927 type:complete len:218 (-) Transcript_12170:190-843(-)
MCLQQTVRWQPPSCHRIAALAGIWNAAEMSLVAAHFLAVRPLAFRKATSSRDMPGKKRRTSSTPLIVLAARCRGVLPSSSCKPRAHSAPQWSRALQWAGLSAAAASWRAVRPLARCLASSSAGTPLQSTVPLSFLCLQLSCRAVHPSSAGDRRAAKGEAAANSATWPGMAALVARRRGVSPAEFRARKCSRSAASTSMRSTSLCPSPPPTAKCRGVA